MRCLLSIASLGSSIALFSEREGPVLHQWQGSSIDTSAAKAAPSPLSDCPVTVSPGSTIEGGKVLFSYNISAPGLDSDDDEALWARDECCQFYTKAHEGQTWTSVKTSDSAWAGGIYLCTLFDGGEIVAGDKTSSAAKMGAEPEPEDYHCKERKTVDKCLDPVRIDPQRNTSGLRVSCAWHGDACHEEPPIECGRNAAPSPWETPQPLCVNIILADHAVPGPPAGRQLGSFNLTDGSVTQGEPIVKEPTQVLELGASDWWSVGSGYVKNEEWDWIWDKNPFTVCVRYNELLHDGTADDDSWFSVCASGPGYTLLQHGTSSRIKGEVYFGQSSANTSWATFVFWSNETSGSVLQI